MPDQSPQYDRKTLIVAAAILIGFALLLYFLPTIMLAIGGENRWLAGAVVVLVLALPFGGLWLRGKSQRRK